MTVAVPAILEAGRRRFLSPLLFLVLGQLGAAAANVWLVRATFDRAFGDVPGRPPLALVFGLVSTVALAAELRRRERIVAERFGQDYVVDVRRALFARLIRVDATELHGARRGGILLRFLGDLAPLKRWVSLGLVRLPVAALTVLVGLLALGTASVPVALGVGLSLLLGGAVGAWVGRRLYGTLVSQRRARTRLASNVAEKVEATETILAHGRESRELRRIVRQGQVLAEASVERVRAQERLRACVQLAQGLATVAALVVGAGEVAAGRASVGGVVAGIALVGLISPSLRDLARVFEVAQGVRLTRARLETFFQLPYRREEATAPMPWHERGLVLDGVSLPAGDKTVQVHARVDPGEFIALDPKYADVWRRLGRACVRLEPIPPEAVRWRGTALAARGGEERARLVGLVTTDLPFVRGSLSKNLRYRARRAGTPAVEEMISVAGFGAADRTSEHGLATRLGAGARELSRAERTALAFGRGLLDAPEVALVTAELDDLTPEVRARFIGHLMSRHGVTLVVTDDPELCSRADSSWTVEAGHVTSTPATRAEHR